MHNSRRHFLLKFASLAVPVWAFGRRNDPLTVRQVIDLVLQSVPGAPFASTVDTIKVGNIDQRVT
ncbi:MAG TPA: hypothetical protein VLC28_05670, partial [Flavitalea sp.]|nr:hypothetical protein [Flavitalea sp.]